MRWCTYCPVCLMPLPGQIRETLHFQLDHRDELQQVQTAEGLRFCFEGGVPFQHGIWWTPDDTFAQAYAWFMFIYGGNSVGLNVETELIYTRRYNE